MIGNEFRNALRSGKTVYGTLISSTSPKLFDTTVSMGLDFIFLCNEHVLYNQDSLGWMCRAYKAAGLNPVVRILSPDPYLATQALDAGAGAILVPYVEDIEDVYDLIGAVKYRPLKGKKLKKLLYGEEKPTDELKAYLKNHNRNNTLLINIESQAGAANLDEFLAIQTFDGPGVDGIVLGPHDLSVSYEMPEKYRSEEFLKLSCEIITKARARGVAAGGHNGARGNLDLLATWAKAGANIILNSSDMFLFADRLQDEMNVIRQIKGEKASSAQESISI
ncbi:aldolase/citrate lyase family protein [Danxiaibacter flavus]|uniref:Aldolase/citrate lyase family protein n=1 Tax=Danxiaibacter flavus TaxID=3049108 RepID=A0ABV3ZQ54_9BACT|nr:aldolase/citrate lyase family protein [Chitinophagaceae bacterium DXS]